MSNLQNQYYNTFKGILVKMQEDNADKTARLLNSYDGKNAMELLQKRPDLMDVTELRALVSDLFERYECALFINIIVDAVSFKVLSIRTALLDGIEGDAWLAPYHPDYNDFSKRIIKLEASIKALESLRGGHDAYAARAVIDIYANILEGGRLKLTAWDFDNYAHQNDYSERAMIDLLSDLNRGDNALDYKYEKTTKGGAC